MSTTTTTTSNTEIAKKLTDAITAFTSQITALIKQITDGNGGVVNPPPQPPGPGPTGEGIGPDGIKEIYPTKQGAKAKPFYIDLDNPDKDAKTFGTTYGGDLTKFNKTAMDGKVKCVTNPGHKQTYASGAPPGKSCRFHISAGGNNNKPGKYSWKDKPTPAYVTATDVCFYSHEMTVIAKVGKALGTHQSFAFKVNSRPDQPDDNLRSTIEMCMPNDQKPDVYVNYNYAHKSYERTPGVKQYFKEGKITPGQIIGVKYIHSIADDKKSTYMAMYVNLDPIDLATGQIKNENWKLKADYVAKGISAYDNIPPVWGGDSYLRVDGYDGVTLYAFSQREIDKQTAQTQGHVMGAEIAPEEVPPVAEDEGQFESADEFADVDEGNPNTMKMAIEVNA
jgi:hypothetical protein